MDRLAGILAYIMQVVNGSVPVRSGESGGFVCSALLCAAVVRHVHPRGDVGFGIVNMLDSRELQPRNLESKFVYIQRDYHSCISAYPIG